MTVGDLGLGTKVGTWGKIGMRKSVGIDLTYCFEMMARGGPIRAANQDSEAARAK